VKDAIAATLPPHACQILALRPMLDHPFIISTSRHVTQGMIDVTNEHWDPATRTLSGISRVVGGDPYELRIACANAASLRITKATANAPQARPSDLTIALGAQGQAQGGGFRATISSPYDAAGVFWQITFADNL
jgi:hypothetical protein